MPENEMTDAEWWQIAMTGQEILDQAGLLHNEKAQDLVAAFMCDLGESRE